MGKRRAKKKVKAAEAEAPVEVSHKLPRFLWGTRAFLAMLAVAFWFYQAAIGPYPFIDLPWLPIANFVGLVPLMILMFLELRLQAQGFEVSLKVAGDDLTISDRGVTKTVSLTRKGAASYRVGLLTRGLDIQIEKRRWWIPIGTEDMDLVQRLLSRKTAWKSHISALTILVGAFIFSIVWTLGLYEALEYFEIGTLNDAYFYDGDSGVLSPETLPEAPPEPAPALETPQAPETAPASEAASPP